MTTFTKGNDKVKWAQNSDQDLAIEATFTPATATTPGTAHTVIKPAGKTPTNAEVEAKGGPAKKTAEEAAEQMIEQLQTVSGMSRDDAKAWLGDMLPKANATSGGRKGMTVGPTLVTGYPGDNVPDYSACGSRDIGDYVRQYGCWNSFMESGSSGADWWMAEQIKTSGSVSGWWRYPTLFRNALVNGPGNTINDYSPYYTRQDTDSGCRTETVGLTVGIGSWSQQYNVCKGKLAPHGPFNNADGVWFGPEWQGNAWAVSGETYGVVGDKLVHSPPSASYSGTYQVMDSSWRG